MDFKGNNTMLCGYGKRTRIFSERLNLNLVSFFLPLALVEYEIITAYYITHIQRALFEELSNILSKVGRKCKRNQEGKLD